MKSLSDRIKGQSTIGGRVSLLLLWLIGIPAPILIIIFLFRGCSG